MEHGALRREHRMVTVRLGNDVDDEAVAARFDRGPQQHRCSTLRDVARAAAPDVDPNDVVHPRRCDVRKVRSPVIARSHKEPRGPVVARYRAQGCKLHRNTHVHDNTARLRTRADS